ncbi:MULTISPECIES: Abi family protein [Photorhabdus]|uniref:Abi family protein n=2 Tax=Photorhabdus TaxID=29487 RepID=A0A329V9Z6_9GAMM|nr:MULTISPECIES: Abi family protein [Photorhabdus]PQQ42199.1 hypothetical protein C6H65_04290 [Photorhabdus luminescens]MBS9431937.1 Abi family protein [Photorhabdus hainanensis]QXF31881.1 hypothetical protein B0X70_00830 [Photorhabdus akhurstii]RAW81938.1 hypothetical protein CKY01_22530 [Photorhabdus laumondii subsp. clarkei]UJD73675.1 hypothetical protein CE143_00825 [Photorhabdus luminescens]
MSVYNKPFLTPAELVNIHLEDKGVLFTHPFNKVFAEKALSLINWYRFKSYLYPYLNHSTKEYLPGTEFKNGFDLYLFDCELRELCNKYILRIEVKAKSILDQVITKYLNDPFWYLSDDVFTPNKAPYQERMKIKALMEKSTQEFAVYYKNNYTSTKESYRQNPPFWIAIELMSFDSMMKLIAALDTTKFTSSGKNHLNDFATAMGANTFKEVKSWLYALKELRNKSSHSSRTWNSNYRLPSGFVDNNNNIVGTRITIRPTMKNKIYTTLIVLKIMSKTLISPSEKFEVEFKNLINKYSYISILTHSMGIPSGWDKENIWN